jgi:hypothetical protein
VEKVLEQLKTTESTTLSIKLEEGGKIRVEYFAVGYPGYLVFDAVWPSFDYSPIPVGKNAWFLGQAFFIAVSFAGAIVMVNTVRRALNTIPAIA